MKFFKERKEIEKKYKKWAKKNNVLDCPFSVITFVDCYYGEELEKLKWYKAQYDKMKAVGMTTPAKINKKFEELKQQLAEKDEDHERLIDDFQQERENLCKQIQKESEARQRAIKKLAEKDKEIEKLKEEVKKGVIRSFQNCREAKEWKWFYLKEKNINDKIRHQICEEIKMSLLDVSNPYWRYFKDGNQYMTSDDLLDSLKEIKNQIEQGERR